MPHTVRSAEVSELRAFCAAVDLGSLGRAARLLRVSQPALSKRLRGLEALSGTTLLERSPRGVSPTPAGARLYVEARKLLAQAEAVEGLMAGLSDDDAPVRVAASHTIAEFVLPGPLVEFQRGREHHLSLELVVANSTIVRELVREGRAELGIAAADPAGRGDGAAPRSRARQSRELVELPFCKDEVVIGVPPGHPWAEVEEVEIERFAATPMVMRDPSASQRGIVDAALAERGLALALPIAEVGSTSAAKETALAENAPILLSRLAMAGEGGALLVRRVRGVRFERTFVTLVGAEGTLRQPARALLEHLRSGLDGGLAAGGDAQEKPGAATEKS